MEFGERIESGTFCGRGRRLAQGLGIAQRRREQVGVDADQPVQSQAAHGVGDLRAHVAPLRHVPGVTQASHQLRPGLSDTDRAPAQLGRLVGEPVAGDRRQHEVEGVLGAAAVGGRVGEWTDSLEQLDDRARPAVGHDQRQRVLVCRFDVDEVDVQPVDLGLELRQRVQSCLAPAPVVLGRPVPGQVLYRRQLHTLRPTGDEFPGRPARRIDATAQLVDLALRYFDSERPHRPLRARSRGVTHDRVLPIRVGWASCRSSSVATSKRTSCGEHRAEDSMKREAAHDSRPPLEIGNDFPRSSSSVPGHPSVRSSAVPRTP